MSRVRLVRAWGPSTGPTACALAGRHCSLWGWRRGVTGGGACHRCQGRLVSGAVPPPAARNLERAARVPRPVCPGCGRCGRGDPAPVPQRAPLRAGVARCEGGGRASPGGGALHRCEGRLRSGAVPPPTARPLGRLFGSALTCCTRGCAGVGAQYCSLGLHALWGMRAARVVGSRPRGGWPATVVRNVCCQALSLPWPPVFWSGHPGFRDPCVPGAVRAGVGTQHRPHSVRPCGLALLAVGVAEGRPRGAAFHHCEGCLRSGAVPPPPMCCRCGCVGVGPQHCPLGLHAPWGLCAAGVVGGLPRGGWPATVVRGVWCQALSLPRPPVLLSGQPGFRDPCVPGAVGAGVGTQHRPHRVRPCGRAFLAVGVAEGRPRGGCLPPL